MLFTWEWGFYIKTYLKVKQLVLAIKPVCQKADWLSEGIYTLCPQVDSTLVHAVVAQICPQEEARSAVIKIFNARIFLQFLTRHLLFCQI